MLLGVGRMCHARCKYYELDLGRMFHARKDGWCLKKFFVKSPFAQNEKSKLI